MKESFKFQIFYGSQVQSYKISVGSRIIIGRSNEEGQLHIDHPALSKRHISLTALEKGVFFEDLGSTNGTYLNSRRIPVNRVFPLSIGDKISLSPDNSVILQLDASATKFTSDIALNENKKLIDIRAVLSSKKEVLIGRSAECDIILDDIVVSRKHARILQEEGKVWIEDLNSSNGVFVNGKKISGKKELSEKDRLLIGLYAFSLNGTLLDLKKEFAISAKNISKVFSNGNIGLQSTTIKFPYREFIALMGPSGCGKSTLLKALNGDSPPSRGSVKIFDLDMHDHFDLIKHIIGYVPQENIVHEALTVNQALYFSAKIRLPEDVEERELESRISEVLKSLRIDSKVIRNTKIAHLSGGQKKRVSIAVELLTKPKILFLDEPTSPLDPETIEEFLTCIRELCKEGTTVIMVTHKPEDLNFVDRVVFMGVNGHLSYDGHKGGLLKHYGKENLINLYALLSNKEESKRWYERWFIGRTENATAFKKLEFKKTRSNVFHQSFWLTMRYFRIKTGNPKNLLLLLLQPIFIAILVALSFPTLTENNEFFGVEPKLPVIFLMAIAAIWFGVSNSAKEIVGELDIANREFKVNILLGPYILSKQVVLLLLSAIQTLIFLIILSLVYPGLNNFYLIFCILLLLSLCSIQFGLMLSSLTETVEEVMSLLPIALMPQIILSGILQPIHSSLTMFLSYLTLGRWGTELLVRAQDFGEGNKLFLDALHGMLYPEDFNLLDTDAFGANLILIGVLFVLMFLTVVLVLLKRVSPSY